ncbi:inovirus-type Gp2 protein [Burkholderia thailandensis]|uniref:YagK/YfjJ domain-containing protein n=1 Tax=Burkholderia thailandensis TaxID=57975 RepID=UPI00192DAF47|nr:inovirus-type Gp2 protein [Burkholderia thailandensis]MBS2127227.1 inovirus-type Gp2 protein [Burkholderia thailandensis]MCS6516586.1 inovirus Gp2 family protein [Burkholderia thailandensis]QRA12332.1 inovirus-type Gp2 protein [Burkholderia thailandensis]
MKEFLAKRVSFPPRLPWVAIKAKYRQVDQGFPTRSNLFREDRSQDKDRQNEFFIQVCHDMQLNAGNAGVAAIRFFFIESFVRDVLEFDKPAFSFSLDDKANIELLEEHGLGRYFFELGRYRSRNVEGLHLDSHTLSPYVEFFFDALQACYLDRDSLSYWPSHPSERLPKHPWKIDESVHDVQADEGQDTVVEPALTPVYMGEVFNDFLKELRRQAKDQKLKKKVLNRDRDPIRELKSMQTYVDSLFKEDSGYSRLLVLRLDFGYREDYSQTVTIDQVKEDWKTFKNRSRFQKAFKYVVGGIWKLEWGVKRGHHLHCIFFLKGSNVWDERTNAEPIGECWQRAVPEGTGTFHISNLSQFDRRAVGMIEASDTEKRGYLMEHLGYLAKKEQALQIKLTDGTRTFGKWQSPKERSNRAGRPRTKNAPVKTS